MAKQTILERKINAYEPVNGQGDCVAIIEGFTAHFFAPTPMQAVRKADDWRKREWNKINSKKNRVPVDDAPVKPKPAPEQVADDEDIPA